MHVVTTRRRYKGRVYETHLLRRSYREDGRVKNETLGNLSHLPEPVVDLVRRALRGGSFVPVAERLEVLASRPHGHVQAVRLAMQRLQIDSLISSRADPERDAELRAHRGPCARSAHQARHHPLVAHEHPRRGVRRERGG